MPGPAAASVITDTTDARLNDYRELKDATRKREGTFIAESELVIKRLFTSRFSTRSILLTPQRFARLAPEIPPSVEVLVAHEDLINSVVGFPLHRGAVAVAERRAIDLTLESVAVGGHTVVVLEDVVDPDNIGAVFRHSAAFGVDAVILSPHAGDPLYRKAIRASMGWCLHVPWFRIAEHGWPDALDTFKTHGWEVLGLTPHHSVQTLPQALTPRPSRVALLLGTEHIGLSDRAMSAVSKPVSIPMAPGVDSLNVATTAAIALYELQRAAFIEPST
jgi:tRNA G18 (ribose-2'-O)-methylase SpoU